MAEFGPPPAITHDQLIEVLERNFEPHWIQGLLADPKSQALFEGMIAILLRIQAASDENLEVGTYILTAPGLASAVSTVRLTRPSGAAVTIPANSRFLDERGAVWIPQAAFDIAASGGPQTVNVPIRTDRGGYWLNSFQPLTYQILDALPDPNLVVVLGIDPATAGTTPYLDQHGKERQVFRAEDEGDEGYARRIRFLEDQVSPKALADTVVEVLDGFPATKVIADLIALHGLRVYREPFQDSAQISGRGITGLATPYADDVQPIPLPAPAVVAFGTFADDVAGHLIRSIEDVCAFFDILLPTPIDPDEARQFYDDGDADFGAFFDDPLLAYFDVPAGPAITSPIAALADELNRRRAGCVPFRIILGVPQPLLRHPPFGTLQQAGDWVDQDGAATDLELTTALAAFDADFLYVESATGTGPGAPAAAGDLIFNLAAVPAPLTIDRVILRARVRQADLAVGTDPEFQFIIQPTTAGVPERVGVAFTVVETGYVERVAILEENPITAAAWTLADIAGSFRLGIANVAAVGATEELRVSELSVEFVVNYG